MINTDELSIKKSLLKKTKSRRYFTLLEVMVGLTLLLIAAGAIGWKMHGFIEKRRFQSDLDRLKFRLMTLQTLSANMQSDWLGVLRREKKNWIFESHCIDQPKIRFATTGSFQSFEIFFNNETLDTLEIFFYSSGEVKPMGSLLFHPRSNQTGMKDQEWVLPEIFQKQKGDGVKNLGPIHPDEIGLRVSP